MKTNLILISLLFAALLGTAALADTKDSKILAGPKGGRILTARPPHAEFFVAGDRKIVITFYDANLKPLPPGAQVVSAIVEAKTGKVKLEFAKTADGFRSTQPLPEGEGYRVVVQLRESTAAKPVNYRVDFHDEICGECKRAEYACTCEGHGGEGHKH